MWKLFKEERLAFGIIFMIFIIWGFAYEPVLKIKAERDAAAAQSSTDRALEAKSGDGDFVDAPLFEVEDTEASPETNIDELLEIQKQIDELNRRIEQEGIEE